MRSSSETHRHVATALLLFILTAYGVMALRYPLAYLHATYEDLLGEWTQVFLFAATLVLALRLALTSGPFRLFFAVLALACFYVVGEEISWGQRLLNLSPPEFFLKHNLQQETNLHNFFTGPVGTWVKRLLEYGVSSGLLVYGLLLPLALRARWPFALRLERMGLALPPLYLWPYFAAAAVLELQLFSFNEAEIAELLVPLALGITCIWHLGCRPTPGASRPGRISPPVARLLGRQTLMLALGAFFLAGASTLFIASSPRLAALTEQRIENGLDRFANRYERYGAWSNAEALYLILIEGRPDRADLWRRLHRVQRDQGKSVQAEESLQAALATDQAKLIRNPGSVGTHLSLTRTYRLLGQEERAQEHLGFALARALEWSEEQPQNPRAFYWLGKAQDLKGDRAASRLALEQAATLDPLSLTYSRELARLRKDPTVSEKDDA